MDWVLVCPRKQRQTRPQIQGLALGHPCWLIVVAWAHSEGMTGNSFFPTWTDQEPLKWSGILFNVCSFKITLKLLDHLLFLFCLQAASAYLYWKAKLSSLFLSPSGLKVPRINGQDKIFWSKKIKLFFLLKHLHKYRQIQNQQKI